MTRKGRALESVERKIKTMHDFHIHQIDGQSISVDKPCPECPRCKCKVHQSDPNAVITEELVKQYYGL